MVDKERKIKNMKFGAYYDRAPNFYTSFITKNQI